MFDNVKYYTIIRDRKFLYTKRLPEFHTSGESELMKICEIKIMNCIKTIEDTIKSVLTGLHNVSVENRLDDTEYIRNVKAVLEATEAVLKDNAGSPGDTEILEVLYIFSKELWLKNLKETKENELLSEYEVSFYDDDDEYQGYYYDYIYNKGVYPP